MSIFTPHDLSSRLVGFGFWSSLVLLAFSVTLAVTFATPRHFKQALNDSTIYEAAAGIIGGRASILTDDPTTGPALKRAVNAALPPDQVRSASEQFIDGIYRWLDGSTAAPDFRIETAPAIARFKSVIGDEAVRQAGTLPPGLTSQIVRDQAIAQVTGSSKIFSESALTVDSIPKNNQGQAFYETAPVSATPAVYQILMLLPWIFGIACIIWAGLLYFLRRNALRTSYDLAKVTFRVGLVLLVLIGLAHVAFVILTQPGGGIVKFADGTFQRYIIAFIRSLEATFSQTILLIGVVYSVVGGIVIVSLRLVALRRLKHMDDNTELPPLAPIIPTGAAVSGTIYSAAPAPTNPGATIVPQPLTPGTAIVPSVTTVPTTTYDEDEKA